MNYWVDFLEMLIDMKCNKVLTTEFSKWMLKTASHRISDAHCKTKQSVNSFYSDCDRNIFINALGNVLFRITQWK